MSYGPDSVHIVRRSASYVDRIPSRPRSAADAARPRRWGNRM